jgi:MerR family transcriptional regulator, light-induced transcriptional regulator
MELRIGELARRTGVSVELLRAWEKRYRLLQPARTNSGYRLYSAADEERVARMRRGLDEGLAAAEAARAALEEPVAAGANLDEVAAELRLALEAYDDATAQGVLDRLLATFTFETVAGDVLLPLLREVGDRWERGETSVAQEHFASNVLRGRLLSIARGWDRGVGPRAVLACAPGERHELALIMFGIALRAQGWRVTYLGVDTPVEAIDPGVADDVVIAATDAERFTSAARKISALAKEVDVSIAGAGASEQLAKRLGARLLPADPFRAAAELASGDLHVKAPTQQGH